MWEIIHTTKISRGAITSTISSSIPRDSHLSPIIIKAKAREEWNMRPKNVKKMANFKECLIPEATVEA